MAALVKYVVVGKIPFGQPTELKKMGCKTRPDYDYAAFSQPIFADLADTCDKSRSKSPVLQGTLKVRLRDAVSLRPVHESPSVLMRCLYCMVLYEF